MPKSFMFMVLAYCALVENLYSQSARKYRPATVVHVHEYALPSTYIEDTGIGAPELPEIYNYDIAVQVSCDVYTGRYQSDKELVIPVLGLDRASTKKGSLCQNRAGSRYRDALSWSPTSQGTRLPDKCSRVHS